VLGTEHVHPEKPKLIFVGSVPRRGFRIDPRGIYQASDRLRRVRGQARENRAYRFIIADVGTISDDFPSALPLQVGSNVRALLNVNDDHFPLGK
jgi:hypothetical protein